LESTNYKVVISELVSQFRKQIKEGEAYFDEGKFKNSLAKYFLASESADSTYRTVANLLIENAPSEAYRGLFLEMISWQLRYYNAQFYYHFSVAMTTVDEQRNEWIARLITVVKMSKVIVNMLLNIPMDRVSEKMKIRIDKLLKDWGEGLVELVERLRLWNVPYQEVAHIIEWARDQGIDF